jgi:hypothetical protein
VIVQIRMLQLLHSGDRDLSDDYPVERKREAGTAKGDGNRDADSFSSR